MGFVASEAAEPLDYDFTKFVKGPGAKGTIPEPSQKAMRAYRKAIFLLLKEYEDLQNVNAETMSDDDAERFQERAAEVEDKMDELTAELCQNTPSVEVLSELPFRHKVLFSQWLQGEFNPENLTQGSKR